MNRGTLNEHNNTPILYSYKMGFSDIIDIVTNLALLGNRRPNGKRPEIYMLFYVLIIPGLFWFLVELHTILELPSPIAFIAIFTGTGFLISIGTIITMYKLGLIEYLKGTDMFAVLIPVILFTISTASFINRCYVMAF